MARKNYKKKTICAYVSDEEYDKIQKNMKVAHFRTLSSYLTKAAIDCQIFIVDLPQLRQINSQLDRIGNNVNQFARTVNSRGNICDIDIGGITDRFSEVCMEMKDLNQKLTEFSKKYSR